MQITYAVKDWFLDRERVKARMDRARRRALMLGGSYTRRAARDQLRRGKSSATAGQPPKIHSRFEPHLKTILFALDPATDSVVVGPVLLNAKGLRGSNRRTIPELLEHGGTAAITEYSLIGSDDWRPLDAARKARGTQRRPLRRRTRTATYGGNPFMAPALARALPDIPEQFRDLL